MKILHLLATGYTGGIEVLCKEYACNSKLDNIFLFLWGNGQIAQEMLDRGDNVINMNASKLNPVKSFVNILFLCKKENITSVVVHHSAPMMHVYLILIKLFKPYIKTYAYAHCDAKDMCPSERRFLWLREAIIRQSLYRADMVIAISYYVKKSLINYYKINDSKIKVIYNGVDLKKFLAKLQRRSSFELIELTYIGRLIKNKGVQIILQGLSLLPDDSPFHFNIVGDGPYRLELEQLTKKYKLCKKVKFWGTQREVSKILLKSDVFVHVPIWEEGFGITVVEAMAAGLVTVCSRSGALQELIENGENGFLVNKNSPNEVANIFQKIFDNINSPCIWNIRVKTQEKATQFSIQRFTEELDSTLNEKS
ncbi:MAG: glycosyltransferase family 4 protein [Sedimentibacter sp.]|uniref:glycosyltransferase family 4 protein n=1 Tax=Sedimentibacter sp. TaxID=1960295 RepID=UPI003158E5C5